MSRSGSEWSLRSRRLPRIVDPESAFGEIFAAQEHAFWLDSSLVERGLSRFSFFGGCEGPDCEVLSYRVTTGTVEVQRPGQPTTLIAASIFDVLEQRLAERAIEQPADLPFDFDCGYVGYLGYEMKGDCGAPSRLAASLPDALWMAATRLIAVDHLEQETWLLALSGPGTASEVAAEQWLTDTRKRLRSIPERVPARKLAWNGVEEFDPEPWLVRP